MMIESISVLSSPNEIRGCIPVASDSPPLGRTRNRKRQRSPPESESPSTKEDKKGKVEEPVPDKIAYNIENVEESFQFKTLVDKFANN